MWRVEKNLRLEDEKKLFIECQNKTLGKKIKNVPNFNLGYYMLYVVGRKVSR